MDIGRLWDNWHSFLGRLERSQETPEINIERFSECSLGAARKPEAAGMGEGGRDLKIDKRSL